jgi:hypothetical protein
MKIIIDNDEIKITLPTPKQGEVIHIQNLSDKKVTVISPTRVNLSENYIQKLSYEKLWMCPKCESINPMDSHQCHKCKWEVA